jgi:hypothetical protein
MPQTPSPTTPQSYTRSRAHPIPHPAFRRLRGYAFDPSLSVQMETAFVNEVVFRVAWDSEGDLSPGPVNEYLEIVDVDPASGCYYAPVDLHNEIILAQDGLDPSEGNPQFHQQMVYAVAMTTIRNFERALGRWALWSPKQRPDGSGREEFVQRLRVYPHAMREANAYYSQAKKALLFGYFSAHGGNAGRLFPGGIVFTCLSHDIIAHETSHALLDGMHRRFIEPTNHDVLAFHEAFADIVALFQHFTFPEILRHQIAKTRGDLQRQSLLGELAQQFGQAIGHYGALRTAIGGINPTTGKWERLPADPDAYQTITEPHARGAILVAAVFDAFLSIYHRRVGDLLRIATSGTGVLPEGEIHPDLVNRLAAEAAKTAQHVLTMCIRALDYCPPVDITFGDFLRAIITADFDLVRDDDLGYRVAVIEAFRQRGIYPRDVRALSEDSLRWGRDPRADANGDIELIAQHLRALRWDLEYPASREDYFNRTRDVRGTLHKALSSNKSLVRSIIGLTGLSLDPADMPPGLTSRKGQPSFEVHSFWPVRRVGPDGDALNQVIMSIMQRRLIDIETGKPLSRAKAKELGPGRALNFRGGVTLVIDLETLELRYAIAKPVSSQSRLDRTCEFVRNELGASLRGTYLSEVWFGATDEPLAVLHRLHANAPVFRSPRRSP